MNLWSLEAISVDIFICSYRKNASLAYPAEFQVYGRLLLGTSYISLENSDPCV